MFRLFTLTAYICLFIIGLSPVFAMAASGEVRTRVSNSKNQVFLTTPTLSKFFTISTSFSSIDTEDTARLIQKHQQTDFGASIEANIGENQIQLNHNQVVTQSSSAYKTYELLFAHYFYSKTSAAGIQLSETSQLQPYQTFIHPVTAVTTIRPTTLHRKSYEFFYEQILSEQLRGRYSLLMGQVTQDRPFYLGAEARHSFSVNNNFFVRIDTGLIQDDSSRSLKDDRGYFSTYWTELSASYQPHIDWTHELGVGTVVEKEFQPSPLITNALTQVGTDTYFMKTTYQGSGWQTSLLINYQSNNIQQNSTSVSGELSWEI